MENNTLKFIKRKDNDYNFLIVETGKELTLKIYKDKEFKNTLKIGDIGIAAYSNVWLNEWKKLESKKPLKEEKVKKPVVSTFDKKNEQIIAQSTLKEAVKICFARNTTAVKDIKEVHKELYNYMINEEYKNE